MSALRDLVYGKGNRPWPYFSEKFPVKTRVIKNEELCKDLEKNIREAGDHLQKRTSAKCLMTRWNMHEEYDSFATIGDYAINLADSCPVAQRTTPDGKKENVPLQIKETWGLIYVLHGLGAAGFVMLTLTHIYFAIRPDKIWLTKSMLFGYVNREQYLDHHDPSRWVVSRDSGEG